MAVHRLYFFFLADFMYRPPYFTVHHPTCLGNISFWPISCIGPHISLSIIPHSCKLFLSGRFHVSAPIFHCPSSHMLGKYFFLADFMYRPPYFTVHHPTCLGNIS